MIPARKTRKHHISAKLAKHPGRVTSLPSRLHDRGRTTLHCRRTKVGHLQDAIDCNIRTDDQEHMGCLQCDIPKSTEQSLRINERRAQSG